jgi:hypothetical protein
MRIGVFSDIHWSMGRVYRDVANALPDWDFEFINWSNWEYENLQQIYNRCDAFIVNLAAIDVISPIIDTSNVLFISHGFEENQGRNMSASFTYGMTSESIRPLFPSESKVFLTPNGVDETKFDFKQRDGTLNKIGWCGAPRVWYKQAHWAVEIAKCSDIPISISSGTPCEDDFGKWTSLNYDEVRDWYSGIDLLLITSIPEAKHETGPLPAFEAIVSGVPVIGTAVGNFANIPGPKFTTIEEGVEIINTLKSDPEKMKALAKEQYEYVIANLTYNSFGDKWREALLYVSDLKRKNIN